MAVRAADAAPLAAVAASRAASADRRTSSLAFSASAAAVSAFSLALLAAVVARSEASTARSVCSRARALSRSTMATNCPMVAASWSRARAMCWPVSRYHCTSSAVPLRARFAYFFSSGPAVARLRTISTRLSSSLASYWPASRNFSSAWSVPALSAVLPSRLTLFPPLAMTLSVETRMSSVTEARKPSLTNADIASSPPPRAAPASLRTPWPPKPRYVNAVTRLSMRVAFGNCSARKVVIS